MIDFLVKDEGAEPRAGLHAGERRRRSQYRATGRCAEPWCHGDPEPRHLQAVTRVRLRSGARARQTAALLPASMKRRALLTSGAGAAAAFVLAGYKPLASRPLARAKSRRAASGRPQPRPHVAGLPALSSVDCRPTRRRTTACVRGRRGRRAVALSARSRARARRAADARRIGVLIATDQQDVGDHAGRRAPRRSFLPSRPSRTSAKRRCGSSSRSGATFSSAGRISWPGHAYLMAQDARRARGRASRRRPARRNGVVPAHRGSHAFFAGEEMPND